MVFVLNLTQIINFSQNNNKAPLPLIQCWSHDLILLNMHMSWYCLTSNKGGGHTYIFWGGGRLEVKRCLLFSKVVCLKCFCNWLQRRRNVSCLHLAMSQHREPLAVITRNPFFWASDHKGNFFLFVVNLHRRQKQFYSRSV